MEDFYNLTKSAKIQRLRKIARERIGSIKNKEIENVINTYEKTIPKKDFNEEKINQAYEKYIAVIKK